MRVNRDPMNKSTSTATLELTGDDLKRLSGFQLLSAKPLLLVINVDEADLADVAAGIER